MDTFPQVIVMMAITDTQWGRDDHRQGRREATAAELDAMTDYGWHWADLKGFLAARVNAVRVRWRPAVSSLASAETT